MSSPFLACFFFLCFQTFFVFSPLQKLKKFTINRNEKFSIIIPLPEHNLNFNLPNPLSVCRLPPNRRRHLLSPTTTSTPPTNPNDPYLFFRQDSPLTVQVSPPAPHNPVQSSTSIYIYIYIYIYISHLFQIFWHLE